MDDTPADTPESGRVLRFRARRRRGPYTWDEAGGKLPPERSPVEDVGKYERSETERDDYAHRMKVNAAGLPVCCILIGAGIWIATKMADFRRDQDCVLSGRRNCAQISTVGPMR